MANISDIDLNLLTLLAITLEERNLTRVAKRLRISQSAVSQALDRLRQVLDDPLFVRAPRGVIPTPYALSLEGPLTKLLEDLQKLLQDPGEFDMKKVKATFRIASTDYFEMVALSNVAQALQVEAPGLDLICSSAGGNLPKEKLEDGSLDLAIAGYFRDVPSSFYKQKLYDEHLVGVCRKGLAGKGGLSLDAFVKYPHIRVTPSGVLSGDIEKQLAKKGLTRRVSMGTGYFMSPAVALEKTDYILTIPERIADIYCQRFEVKKFDIPVKTDPIRITQVWHERVHQSPVHQWMRTFLKKSLYQ